MMTEPEHPSARLTDGPGFDSVASDSDFIFLTISRREVEIGNISDALDRLLNLSDNAEHVAKFADCLALVFTGWDNDPRELHQIPQVVRFFRKLTDHWPYWFHFVEKDSPANTIGMLFWLLCDVEVVENRGRHGQLRIQGPETGLVHNAKAVRRNERPL